MKVFLKGLAAALIGGAITGAVAAVGQPGFTGHPSQIAWSALAGAITTMTGYFLKSPLKGQE